MWQFIPHPFLDCLALKCPSAPTPVEQCSEHGYCVNAVYGGPQGSEGGGENSREQADP